MDLCTVFYEYKVLEVIVLLKVLEDFRYEYLLEIIVAYNTFVSGLLLEED